LLQLHPARPGSPAEESRHANDIVDDVQGLRSPRAARTQIARGTTEPSLRQCLLASAADMRRSALLADVLISMGPADAGGFRWARATMPSMLEVGLLGAVLWWEGVADPLRRGAAGCCATSRVSRSWSRPKEAGIEGTSRPFKGGQCPASPDWRRHFKTPTTLGGASHRLKGGGTSRPLRHRVAPRTAGRGGTSRSPQLWVVPRTA